MGFEPTSMLLAPDSPATWPVSTRVLTGRVAGLSSKSTIAIAVANVIAVAVTIT